MDILNILEQLKQKGLDVIQVELLKNAYELQERNVAQLKVNNDALRESNDLLKEKVAKLEQEKQEMVKKLESLPKIQTHDEISEIGKDVLRECIRGDITEFNDEVIISKLFQYSRIQVETAMGELEEKDYILDVTAISGFGGGRDYQLTQRGKELCSSLYEKEAGKRS